MQQEKEDFKNVVTLMKFFQACIKNEKGNEPEWEDQKKLILEGYRRSGPDNLCG